MVEFTLSDDPQVYKMRFDFNALVDVEAETNVNLFQCVMEWPRLLSCTSIRALAYALLKPEHPAVLLKEAGGLFTEHPKAIVKAIGVVLIENGLVLPEKEPEPPSGEDLAAMYQQALDKASSVAPSPSGDPQ